MDVDSANYNKANKPHVEAARDMIALILADHPQRKFDVILDIGCGTGNVTKILSDSIPHNNILAFDMDSTMISYADKNNTNKATDFIIADISKPWDNLDNKLKALEGRVDLIFSNFVLHWIPDDERDLVLDNLFRLLKPEEGLIYSCLALMQPIYDLVRSETKAKIKDCIKIDTFEVQISSWRESMELSGFQDVDTKLNKYEWNFNTTIDFRNMLPIFRNLYLMHIPKLLEMNNQSQNDLINELEEWISEAFSIKSEIPSLDQFDPFDQFDQFDDSSLESEKYTVPILLLTIKAKAIKTTNN